MVLCGTGRLDLRGTMQSSTLLMWRLRPPVYSNLYFCDSVLGRLEGSPTSTDARTEAIAQER
eukprot:722310-Prymnesium_polylepis.1